MNQRTNIGLKVSEKQSSRLKMPGYDARNALLALIPLDEKTNLPSLIANYQNSPSQAIKLLPHARPIA